MERAGLTGPALSQSVRYSRLAVCDGEVLRSAGSVDGAVAVGVARVGDLPVVGPPCGARPELREVQGREQGGVGGAVRPVAGDGNRLVDDLVACTAGSLVEVKRQGAVQRQDIPRDADQRGVVRNEILARGQALDADMARP